MADHSFHPVCNRELGCHINFLNGLSEEAILSLRFIHLLPDCIRDPPYCARKVLRMKECLDVKTVKNATGVRGIEYVAGFIDSIFLQDNAEFFFEHLPHPVFNRILEYEIEGAHRMLLADAVHAPNALLYTHGIPWNVEIDHHVGKLQI